MMRLGMVHMMTVRWPSITSITVGLTFNGWMTSSLESACWLNNDFLFIFEIHEFFFIDISALLLMWIIFKHLLTEKF